MSLGGPGGDAGTLNYTLLVPSNESISTGGDSLIENLNIHYQVGINRPRSTDVLD